MTSGLAQAVTRVFGSSGLEIINMAHAIAWACAVAKAVRRLFKHSRL
jgi:hypothetical protein